jgi:hypothetical protein
VIGFAGGAYVLIAFFCGLGAGVIGRSKGSSFWLWFLVGACVPILGNIAAAVSRNEDEELRRLCPQCNRVCKAYEAQCMRCGAELPFPSEDELIPSAKTVKAMRAAAGR